jgi:hypothetical protein
VTAAGDSGTLLASLRDAGAARLDPLRWHYLERLQARAQAQPMAVQRVLEVRLALALAEYQNRFAQAQQPAPVGDTCDAGAAEGRPAPAPPAATPLGALLHTLAQQAAGHAPEGGAALAQESALGRSELKSVRQFRSTWSKLSADKQLNQALDQAPKNAGPLNSHMLVLRSLALMRDMAPDYFNRFISYADTLLSLEQAGQARATPARAGAEGAVASKPKVRRSRS